MATLLLWHGFWIGLWVLSGIVLMCGGCPFVLPSREGLAIGGRPVSLLWGVVLYCPDMVVLGNDGLKELLLRKFDVALLG